MCFYKMRQFCSIVDEKPAAVYWQICQFGTVFISSTSAFPNQIWLHFTFYYEGEHFEWYTRGEFHSWGSFIHPSPGKFLSSVCFVCWKLANETLKLSLEAIFLKGSEDGVRLLFNPARPYGRTFKIQLRASFPVGSRPRGGEPGFNWEKCNT